MKKFSTFLPVILFLCGLLLTSCDKDDDLNYNVQITFDGAAQWTASIYALEDKQHSLLEVPAGGTKQLILNPGNYYFQVPNVMGKAFQVNDYQKTIIKLSKSNTEITITYE